MCSNQLRALDAVRLSDTDQPQESLQQMPLGAAALPHGPPAPLAHGPPALLAPQGLAPPPPGQHMQGLAPGQVRRNT